MTLEVDASLPAQPTNLGRIAGPQGQATAATAIAAGVTVLLWGSSFPGFRAALEGYSPGPLLLLRFVIASIALLIFARLTRMRMPARQDLLRLAGLGVIGVTLCQYTVVYGEQYVSAGTASFLMALTPAFTALLATTILHERLTVAGWIGIGIALLGTMVLIAGQGEVVNLTAGAAFVAVAAFSEALYFVLQKPFLRRYSGLELATYSFWAATIPFIIFTPGLIAEFPQASVGATAAVVYLALGTGVLGYISWSIANSRLPTSVASLLLAITPILSVVIAWPWLGERPTLLALLGGLVTICGVILVSRRGIA